MLKKVISIILAILILFSCVGCGNKSDSDVGGSVNVKSGEVVVNIVNVGEEFSYVKEQLAEFKIDYVLDFVSNDDGLILVGYTSGGNLDEHGFEEWVLNIKILDLDMDGRLLSETELNLPGNYNLLSADIDGAGNIWLLYANIENNEETVYSIECYERNGKHLKSIHPNLSGFITLSSLNLAVGNSSGNGFYISADDLEKSYAAFFDNEGTILFEIEGIKGICELPDGRIIAKRTSGNRTSFFEVDITTGSLGKEYTLELDVYADYSGGNDSYEMLEVNSDAVYAYRLNEGNRVKLIDWVSQGIYYTYASRHVIMSDEHIYGLEGVDSLGGNIVNLIKFTKADNQPEAAGNTGQSSRTSGAARQKDWPKLTVDGKKVIILAAIYSSSDMISYTVTTFNKNNPEYELQLEIYDDITAFNLDLVAGNIPDVIFISPVMSVDNYANKGLFADLYEFLDNDPDIGREDYVGNMLKVLETDGKLFAIADSFFINTVVGRVSDVGTGTGWTWDDFNALMASKPSGTIPMAKNPMTYGNPQMTGVDFFNHTFSDSSSAFINYEAKKCYFDTPAFTAILEAAELYYPQGANFDVTADDFLEGNPLLMVHRLYSFSYLHNTQLEGRYFGEEISYIGYPTEDGISGSAFNFENLIAISANSGVREGAWEYLKYVLTDFQRTGIGNESATGRIQGFPVRLSALEEYAKEAMNPSFGSDGFYTEDGFYVRTPAERDIQKIYDLIDSITVRMDSIVGIWQIIEEEVSGFFNGQKTAEDVAAIIHNRVSIYLAEMK